MAAFKSGPKHNMVAYLEKTGGNAQFHEIVDFLSRSSIFYALTLVWIYPDWLPPLSFFFFALLLIYTKLSAAVLTSGVALAVLNGSDDENPPPPPPPQTPIQQAPHTVSTIKLPILKKGEYDIWDMKMEHYLSHTDYPIWEVIQKGNGPLSVSTDTNGVIKVLPTKTAEEIFFL
ncbi:hypothetical protein Tco_1140427 [Tanacetum coccineum]